MSDTSTVLRRSREICGGFAATLFCALAVFHTLWCGVSGSPRQSPKSTFRFRGTFRDFRDSASTSRYQDHRDPPPPCSVRGRARWPRFGRVAWRERTAVCSRRGQGLEEEANPGERSMRPRRRRCPGMAKRKPIRNGASSYYPRTDRARMAQPGGRCGRNPRPDPCWSARGAPDDGGNR